MVNDVKPKVVVAMSGGVDSSVTALLLHRAGYQVIGVTLRLYNLDQEELPSSYQGCCTLDDVEDARRVCGILEVPHYVLDMRRQFESYVIDYFLEEYRNGNTPHPCIACNDKIKFAFLAQRAEFLGAKYVATGHYARIQNRDGSHHLLKGLDTKKDQSYVLYGMGQEELGRTLMPVGWYSKPDIRSLANNAGFPNADKPDSQDICFIPLGDYRKFIKERITPTSGRLITTDGIEVGRHSGIEMFTVGQRRGLGVSSSTPLYVTSIDSKSGDVTIGSEEHLYQEFLPMSHINFISGIPPINGSSVSVKIRYKSPEVPAKFFHDKDNVYLRFANPQRAVTPGQAAVLYHEEEVLGGGRISRFPETSKTSNRPYIHEIHARP